MTPQWKQFFIALVTLALVHSAVSFGAYRFLTKTTVESADSESAFATTYTEKVTKFIPTPIVFYIWSGYIGLAAAALYALYSRLTHGQ